MSERLFSGSGRIQAHKIRSPSQKGQRTQKRLSCLQARLGRYWSLHREHVWEGSPKDQSNLGSKTKSGGLVKPLAAKWSPRINIQTRSIADCQKKFHMLSALPRTAALALMTVVIRISHHPTTADASIGRCNSFDSSTALGRAKATK
jgi:hypothetical protein